MDGVTICLLEAAFASSPPQPTIALWPWRKSFQDCEPQRYQCRALDRPLVHDGEHRVAGASRHYRVSGAIIEKCTGASSSGVARVELDLTIAPSSATLRKAAK
jgi:hypothetical protein